LATQHASDAELAGLRKMSIDLDAPNHASANIDEYSSDNIRFHQEIIKLSKCELLSEMAASLFLHMHAIRARSLRGRDRVAGSIVDHAQIIEALEMREAELAERLVREHTEHLSQHVKDYVSWIE
jgi:DNA-binding GntR family transcriptional regulator